ncbi:MAG TPA: protein kinase family protein [Nocardioides sp.]|nr:protein kinase family protein [Nocardioides sp.]
MALSTRPGDLLAGRYRLIDLLSESGGGRFWRAHDRVLERYVALHVIAEDDPRAAGLIAAAQASATFLDPRVLRVLDAETRDGLCYVVNEWGTGTSLDLLLANNGPLGPRRSAWLVADIADAIDRAHRTGVAHGRLNPENVLIDRFGAVRLIGFCVDAALHGLPGDRFTTDLGDLGGLLYSALTGAWPGPSSSLVPAAPRTADEVLSPRQVRAGVPKPLDELWRATAEATDPQLRRRHWVRRSSVTTASIDVSSAGAIGAALLDFIGDPTGLTEALATTVLPINQIRPLDLAPIVDPEIEDVDPDPVAEETVDDTTDTTIADTTDTADDTAVVETREPDDSIPLVTELPTEPGLPVFGDDDEVEWLRTRSTPPPPPPPFEEPPERPLFAPDPPEGQPVRRPRDDVPPPPEAHHPLDRPVPTGDIVGYWPWDHDAELERATTDDETMPGRSWLRLGLGVLVALLLLFAIAVAFNLGSGRTVLGGKPSSSRSTTSSTAVTNPATPLTNLRPAGFDPLRGTDANTAEAARAVDGNPATTWTTARYDQQLGPKPPSLVRGIGLLIDLGAEHTVSDVSIRFAGQPTAVQLYVAADRPTAAPTGHPAASGTATGATLDLTLTSPATGQYVLVWLTRLPAVPGGYRGSIAEVVVRGQ